MNQQTRTGRLAVCLFLYAFVVWAALLLAQSLGVSADDKMKENAEEKM